MRRDAALKAKEIGEDFYWGKPKQIQSKTTKRVMVVVGRESDDASYCLGGIDIGLDRGAKRVSTNRTCLYESEAHDDTSERD